MSTFLLPSSPIYGHLVPMLEVARALVDRGHTVTVLTGTKYRNHVADVGAGFSPLPAGADYDDADLDSWLPGRDQHKGLAAVRHDLIGMFVRPLRAQHEALTAELATGRYDAVVCELVFTGVIPYLSSPAEERLPVVGVSALPLTVSSVDCAPFGPALPPGRSAVSRLRNRVLNRVLSAGPLREITSRTNATLAELGVAGLSGTIFDMALLHDRTYQLSAPSLEYPRRELPPTFRFVGPLRAARRGGDVVLPGWWGDLEAGRPVVHVTQGTIDNVDLGRLVVPTIRGLADAGVLVVASTGGRPVSAVTDAFGGTLPANARVAEFLPYDQLLPRVDVVVTNGGFGGVQQSLAHGVPLVVAGATEDKPEVAARVAWSGTGVDLRTGTPSPATVAAAVRRVLAQDQFRRAANRVAAEISQLGDPLDTLVPDIEQLAGRAEREGAPAGRQRVRVGTGGAGSSSSTPRPTGPEQVGRRARPHEPAGDDRVAGAREQNHVSAALHTPLVAERLRAAGVSQVLDPDDPGFGGEVVGFNTAVQHRPTALVVARSVADVVAAVRVAGDLDLPVTVLGHGHGALAAVDSGIAISTRHLAGVEVDPAESTARVAAGTRWSQVLVAATPHGLAPLCGSAPDVGVVGYLLGGGLGPVARTYGFAADHVRSLQVVTADGRLVRCDAHSEPDLFWALRGGKGGLGVVVEVTIDLLPLAVVQGGGIFWSGEHAAALLRAFSTWTEALPESVTPSVALLRLPSSPELPEVLRGRFVVHLRVAVVGEPVGAAELLAPLRAVAEPLLDTVGALPYAAVGSIHADPVDPMPVVEGGVLLRALPAEAVEALLAVAGPDVPAPLAAVELRLLGGAVSRPPTVPNAVGGRDAAFSLHVVGAPVPELLPRVVPAAVASVLEALAPWGTGGSQINFFGGANDPAQLRACWAPEVAARLDQVRERHDPAGRFPHPARDRHRSAPERRPAGDGRQ